MTMVEAFAGGSDRVMTALRAGLAREFGSAAGEALARRFLAAEDCDFHWDARLEERWIGRYESEDGEDQLELDRVQIVGRLDGHWFVATCIVDGDGQAHGMTGNRTFRRRRQALAAFATVH